MTELKPCPFCGGEAKLIEEWDKGQTFYRPWCNECGVRMPRIRDVNKAVKFWNRRVNDG